MGGMRKKGILGVNLVKVHYMYVWNYYHETPFVQLTYAIKKNLVNFRLFYHRNL
jgi:hypothetical protein